MSIQQYKNHTRFYAPHHFVFYPVLLILLVIACYQVLTGGSGTLVWKITILLLLLIGWLSFMMRQHYALTLQNRLIRLEFRQKYFILTGKDFEPLENQLRFGQIAALRFAADSELIELLEKTMQENLTAHQIKKSIKNWKADHMRV